MLLQKGKLVELFPAYILLIVCLVTEATAQLTQPGHKFKVNVYLPEGCGEADFSGMYGINLVSQKEGTYPRNQDCILHLQVPKGFLFNITFTHFDLEPPTEGGTCTDYLQLYNGHGTEMLLSEPLCGSKLPSNILSNTSVVTLKFHTDNQHEFTGFQLIYDRIHIKTLKELGLYDNVQQQVVKMNQENPIEARQNAQEDIGDELGNTWHTGGTP